MVPEASGSLKAGDRLLGWNGEALRKKVETNHSYPRHILTVHTAGYRFVARPD